MMFWKLLREPFRRTRTRRRALWAVLAIALGTAVFAAMLNVSLEVGDRMGEEVRALGANIVITPAGDSLPVEIGGMDYRPVSSGAHISEQSLPKLKAIFWRNNVKSFAPFLAVPSEVSIVSTNSVPSELSVLAVKTTLVGTWFDYPLIQDQNETFRTGIRSLNPTWVMTGVWASDAPASSDFSGTLPVMLGRRIAAQIQAQPGDSIAVTLRSSPDANNSGRTVFRVSGILSTGGAEDDQVFAPLAAVQSFADRADQVRTVKVSALIKPEDELSRRDPQTMTPEEYDRWYCAPYLSSIMYQIGSAIPGSVVRPIREVAETQGSILGKLNFLMMLLAVLALAAAAMSLSSLASLNVIERRQEIALMKAIGATDRVVSAILMSEMGLQALAGGLLGFLGGQLLAAILGRAVFDLEVAMHWLVLPANVLVALMVSLAGTWIPVHRAVRQQPAPLLRGA